MAGASLISRCRLTAVGPRTIDTASGHRIDFDAPDPEQIDLEDIAGGLSRVCRFAAPSLRFHSVAQHAMLVSELLIERGRGDLALAGLHHDSHEAYVCDLPSPLKAKLQEEGEHTYTRVCQTLDEAIAKALGLPELSEDGKAAIKAADNEALMIEAADPLPDRGAGIAATDETFQLQEPGSLGRSWSPEEARKQFLEEHERLAPTCRRG